MAIVHSKHNLSLSTNAGPSFNAYVDTVKKDYTVSAAHPNFFISSSISKFSEAVTVESIPSDLALTYASLLFSSATREVLIRFPPNTKQIIEGSILPLLFSSFTGEVLNRFPPNTKQIIADSILPPHYPLPRPYWLDSQLQATYHSFILHPHFSHPLPRQYLPYQHQATYHELFLILYLVFHNNKHL